MFTVDILNPAGNKVGPGPITSGVRWRYTQRLSAAGAWELELPATDPLLAYASNKYTVQCYTLIDGVRTWVGGGVIEERKLSLSGGNAPTLVLSGNDLLYDLNRFPVNLEVNYNSPFLGEALYTKLLTFTTGGWSINITGDTPNLTTRFVNESVLNALVTITKKTGQLFRLEPRITYFTNVVNAIGPQIDFKHIELFSAPEDSGLVATNLADPLAIEQNSNACLITDIDRQENAWNLVNLVKPYGAGTGQARLNLAAATQWPDGSGVVTHYKVTDSAGRLHTLVCAPANNFVVDAESFTQYDSYGGQVQFKDIAPITNSDADFAAAANALLLATANWLINQSQPQEHYTLRVAGLRKTVLPGQTIRVVAKQMRDGQAPIDINKSLIIQEVQTEIDAAGLRTVSLTVATSKEFATSGAQVVVDEIQRSLSFQAHPQMGANENTISYREDVDDEYGAGFPFWLSRGTVQINSITLRYKLEKLRSSVKTIGGSASGSVDIPTHTHSVTVPSHHHDVPDHQHNMAFEPGSGGSTVQIFSGGGSPDFGSIVANGIAHTIYVNTNADSGATTSDSSGGATVTSASGGGSTGLTVDISSALTAVYGVFVDSNAPYTVGDLAWTANGQSIAETPTAIGGGWYEIDITHYLVNSGTSRPAAYDNTIEVAVKPPNKTGKKVRITCQVEIRTTIQTTVATG